MINNVTLLGRLTADPELRYTPSGVAVCKFTLAVDRKFTNSQGERETDFFEIVAWRQLAETCANYLVKGQKAAVEGHIQTRYYEREGKKVKVWEIICSNVVFLEAPKSNQKQNQDPFSGEGKPTDLPDDFPF